MTGKIDTSAAAVEILARDVCDRQRMRVFGGAITKSSAEIMRALAAERGALRAEVGRLASLISAALDAHTIELNLSNYDHDQVCLLNVEMIEMWSILDAALKGGDA